MKKINVTPDGIEEVDLTAEEVSQRETDIANAQAEKTAEDNAKAEKDANKASAKAKLMAGEALTEAEADTVVL